MNNLKRERMKSLDLWNKILENLKESVDPALKTLITNIQKTELTQRIFITNQLKNELKVEELQNLTKTSKDKIEAWDKLRVEWIREIYYYIYVTQIFLVCSYIVFSMTGKQLFEINAGKGKLNNTKPQNPKWSLDYWNIK